MARILLVDDDLSFCIMLKAFLEKKGFQVQEAFSASEASRLIREQKFDVMLTDYRLPEKDGLELLTELKQMSPQTSVILMTAYADIRMAVKAIKLGAYEYVTKPVNPDEILLNIQGALKKSGAQEKAEEETAKGEVTSSLVGGFEFVEGGSTDAMRIREYVDLVAPTNMSVIIQGESGTGKEYVARLIHQKSLRHGKPFVAIDCGALSNELAGSEFFGHLKGSFTGAITDKTGQFEAANGGTLFLDEIGNLTYEVQVKLLRAIQERKIRKIGSNKDVEVDVRIITASNEDLMQAVQKGSFREDLYHRLNEFSLHVAPLRQRKDDILLFSKFFLDKANGELGKDIEGFSDNVKEVFLRYSWPGNLREMKNVIKRAVLLTRSGLVQTNALPSEILSQPEKQSTDEAQDEGLKALTGKTEKELIMATLEKVKYNKSKAAQLLNIDRKTLYNKLKQFDINLD